MAFRNKGSLNPHGAPVLRYATLANSITVTENDSMKIDADGFLALGTAGVAVFGHVVGLTKKEGTGLVTDGSAGADVGSFQGTFATASDNETVDQVKGVCDISQFTLWSAELSGTIGTTTGSDQMGVHFDLTDEDTLDETSSTDSSAQYYSWGQDPEAGTGYAIVNIFESEVFNT